MFRCLWVLWIFTGLFEIFVRSFIHSFICYYLRCYFSLSHKILVCDVNNNKSGICKANTNTNIRSFSLSLLHSLCASILVASEYTFLECKSMMWVMLVLHIYIPFFPFFSCCFVSFFLCFFLFIDAIFSHCFFHSPVSSHISAKAFRSRIIRYIRLDSRILFEIVFRPLFCVLLVMFAHTILIFFSVYVAFFSVCLARLLASKYHGT